MALGEGDTALAGRLGGHDQTGALLCAGKRGFLREGAALHQELVEMMVVSRAERAWGIALSGTPVPRWPGTVCPPLSEPSGRGVTVVDSSSGVRSVSAVGLWGNKR